jgi:hypothetical protein
VGTATVIEKEVLEKLLVKLPTLDKRQQEQLWDGIQAEVLARCGQDGLFWLKFVQTRDEADPMNSIKLFPIHLEYARDLWQILLDERRVIIAKSRQMMVSWIVCAFVTWWARFKPHQAIYWQTKAWPDAVKMVCMPSGGFSGRCQFIEDNLPIWMHQNYKPSEGRIQYPNGSVIQALSGGADQVRSATGSIFVEDEFAHQEDQDGVYTAVAPLIQKGAKGIFISSPNGTGNMFATLWHGRFVGEELVHG